MSAASEVTLVISLASTFLTSAMLCMPDKARRPTARMTEASMPSTSVKPCSCDPPARRMSSVDSIGFYGQGVAVAVEDQLTRPAGMICTEYCRLLTSQTPKICVAVPPLVLIPSDENETVTGEPVTVVTRLANVVVGMTAVDPPLATAEMFTPPLAT